MRPYYTFFRVVLFSLLNEAGYAEEIRDVRPPVDFPPNYTFLFLCLGVLIAAGLFHLYKYWSLHTRKKGAAPAIILSPWDAAFQRLNELRRKDLPGLGKTKEYFSELSFITRLYIEERFNIRAPDMTTEEFLLSLKRSPQLNERQKDLLKDFLNSCDMVKFAKYGPTESEIENSFQFVKKFIDETKEVPPGTTEGAR